MSDVARRFTSWAPAYENDGLSRLLGQVQQQAIAALRVESADHLMDLGCGSGAAVRAVAPVVRLAVGVDACPAMITRARGLDRPVNRAHFLVADAHHLPFGNDTFTAFICLATKSLLTASGPV